MSDPVWGIPKWLAKQGVKLSDPKPAKPNPKRRPKMEPKPIVRPPRRVIQLGGRYYPQWNEGSHWSLFCWPGTDDPVWFEQNGAAVHFAQNGEQETWSE
jgi:hypothetical protein